MKEKEGNDVNAPMSPLDIMIIATTPDASHDESPHLLDRRERAS
jgi:hypothetical protein